MINKLVAQVVGLHLNKQASIKFLDLPSSYPDVLLIPNPDEDLILGDKIDFFPVLVGEREENETKL